jgi:hypothetical protein
MRRLVTFILVGILALSGLVLLLRAKRPEEGAPSSRAASPLAEDAIAPAAAPSPAGPRPPPAIGKPLEGTVWREGGAPVRGVRLRLERGDEEVASVVSNDEGLYHLAAADLDGAGADAVLVVNPGGALAGFTTERVPVPPRRGRCDIYLHWSGRTPRFDLVVELVNVRSREAGGGWIRVGFQRCDGTTGFLGAEPGTSRIVLPDHPEDDAALFAVQDDLVAAQPMRRLGPASSPVRLVLRPAGTLRGRVLLPDGRPAAGTEVRVLYDAEPTRRASGQAVYEASVGRGYYQTWEATAGDDGRFEVSGLLPTQLEVWLTHPDGSAKVVVNRVGPEGRDLGAVVLAERSGQVTVEIRGDLPERPEEGATYVAVQDARRLVRRELPIPPGRTSVTFEGLPPGAYAVVAYKGSTPERRARLLQFLTDFGLAEVRSGGREHVVLNARKE